MPGLSTPLRPGLDYPQQTTKEAHGRVAEMVHVAEPKLTPVASWWSVRMTWS